MHVVSASHVVAAKNVNAPLVKDWTQKEDQMSGRLRGRCKTEISFQTKNCHKRGGGTDQNYSTTKSGTDVGSNKHKMNINIKCRLKWPKNPTQNHSKYEATTQVITGAADPKKQNKNHELKNDWKIY